MPVGNYRFLLPKEYLGRDWSVYDEESNTGHILEVRQRDNELRLSINIL